MKSQTFDDNALKLLDDNALVLQYLSEISKAKFWRILTLSVALLIAIWIRAPSFDIIPSVAALIFRLIGFFAYGLMGPTDTFITQAWKYINVGYAVIAGPMVLATLISVMYQRSKRIEAIKEIILWRTYFVKDCVQNININSSPKYLFTLIIISSSLVMLLGVFNFRADASPRYIEGTKCQYDHKSTWIDPWPREIGFINWFNPSSGKWCVNSSGGYFPGFRSALADQYFEKPSRLAEVLSKNRNTFELLTHIPAANIDTFIEETKDSEPFSEFPYIYPLINPLVSLFFFLFNTYKCIRYDIYIPYKLRHQP